MAATDVQIRRIREDLAASESALTEVTINDFYLRATEVGIPSYATEAYVRVRAIDQLIAAAVKDDDVRINELEFKKGNRMSKLLTLRKLWLGNLEEDLAGTETFVMFAALRRTFTYETEYPDEL